MRVQSVRGRVELPEGMRSKLETFRRRVWWIKIGEGVFAGLVGLMIAYAIAFVLDRFWDTPASVRAGLLIAGALGFGIAFPLKCHRWVWRTRQLEQVARLLRHKLPRLGDQLLGIVELAHAESANQQGCSETLVRAAVNQVDREIADRDFSDAVPNPRLRAWGWTAACLAAIVVAAFVVVPAAGSNALLRWLMPWKNTSRYTFAQLDQLPSSLVVPYAEDFSLSASLAEQTAWSPKSGYAKYGEQNAVRSDLAQGGYRFQLPPQKEADELEISVGDARAKLAVTPTMRPELTDVQANVTLPEYLGYSQGLSKDVRGGTLSLVAGSRVSIAATATRALRSASLDGAAQRTEGNELRTAEHIVKESSTHELSWQDELSLHGKRPLVISIRAVEDQAPNITCRDLSFEQVILDSDVLKFQINATDDFGVRLVGMEWSGVGHAIHNPNPAMGEKLLMRGEAEKRDLAVSATFSAIRESIPPQSLRVRMFTEDFLPERKRTYSPTYVIHVLTPEEHAIWLTRQLQRWFRQAEDVYAKEQSLHQTNRELRSLSAEALDQPENRRKVENQAAAEQANARRLDMVSDAGENLIRQAMKNDQFNVATLETWAEMLNALRDIAKTRMPSVADLLKGGANAAATARQGEPTPGAPSDVQAKGAQRVGNARNGGAGSPGAPKKGETAGVPGISDIESGYNEATPRPPQDQKATQASSGRLTLPVTTLMGGGPAPPPRPESPAQEQVAEAVEVQQELLDEFARVAAELQKLLDNLEGSTFVKRLKAVSRKQMEVSVDLANGVPNSFGAEQKQVDATSATRAKRMADREYALSNTMWDIRGDLKAYYNRVRDGKFKAVLDEMDAENAVNSLSTLSDTIRENYLGQANAQAEYWGDTVDRWAEQLVGPACPGGACPPGKGDSLPPAIVLQVMKILEKEINLREETRAADLARPTLEAADFAKRSGALAGTQDEIAKMVLDAIKAIHELPNAAAFGREVGLLTRVEEVMREAEVLLANADTGPPAIAAETEAIELLLQSRRAGGGGGGGGWAPGGGGGGDTQQAALALLGSGEERESRPTPRVTGQATGTAGSQFPAEFRGGLDAFFSGLEGAGGTE